MSNPWETINPPASNLNCRRVDDHHPFNFLWAKDPEGSCYLVLDCNSKAEVPEKLPTLKGVQVLHLSNPSGKSSILIKLLEKQDVDLFYALCMDLIGSTREAENELKVMTVLLKRLKRWHLFLNKSRTRILSESEQKGLIGELIFLRDYLLPKFTPEEVLSFWQGPLDATQDFAVLDTAVEVKCRLGTSKPSVSISSAEQLVPQLDILLLFVVTLSKGAHDQPDVINLPIIINEISSIMEDADPESMQHFTDLLLTAGYLNLPEYSDYHFVHSNSEVYEVADGFPRLRGADIPNGVACVRYDVLLDYCRPYNRELSILESLGGRDGRA